MQLGGAVHAAAVAQEAKAASKLESVLLKTAPNTQQLRNSRAEKEVMHSSFYESLDYYFPGALEMDEYLDQVEAQVNHHGFNRESTLPLVCLCRDEICLPLLSHVGMRFGKAFQCSSLGGFLFLGKTGLRAAQGHAPEVEGKQHVLYLAMPHIGFNVDGTPGFVSRHGQCHQTDACGALSALRSEMASGCIHLTHDEDDQEMTLMRRKLLPKITYGEIPGQVRLTALAARLIKDDLIRLVELLHPVKKGEKSETLYTILTGIQIHGNVPGRDKEARFIWPLNSYVVDGNGTEHEIKFNHDPSLRA